MKWSLQKPEKQAKERNPDQVEYWKTAAEPYQLLGQSSMSATLISLCDPVAAHLRKPMMSANSCDV